MKVVLFAGGLGTRLRDYDENIPKPMVSLGYRPIMWHLMKYYAHHGHKDFIICLGYKADVVKKYFLEYNEALSNNFVMAEGGQRVRTAQQRHPRLAHHVRGHGPSTPIGERLRRVKPYLAGEEMFLANYTDCVSDMDLNAYVSHFAPPRRSPPW